MTGTRVVFETTRLRVFHECIAHDADWREFTTTRTRIYENGRRLYMMTRCDGSPMEVWDNEPGVEVIEP